MSRALVLSGGGPVGIAWQTGLAAGLAAKGVVIADADFVVGTSAGSAVGAQLALGHDPAEQVERYRRARARSSSSTSGASSGAVPPGANLQALMDLLSGAASLDGTPEENRAAIGRIALAAETMPEDDFVASFRYLRGAAWPVRFACTAVDALSGAFVVWDRSSGVELDRAVASSCSVPGVFPPISLCGRRYIDGGMRSVANADLAKGHDRVLIVSLDPPMDSFRQQAADEVATLRDSGSAAEIVVPDEDAAAGMSANLLDPAGGFTAVELGLAQGERVAARVGEFWS